MVQTTARIRKGKNNFEILVDLEEALKVRKGEGDVAKAVLTNGVFYDLKKGEHAAKNILEIEFGTGDFYEICKKIITNGEVVLPSEYLKQETEQKYKQVVDFLSKNAVSPQGIPYTPDRIMKALKEAKVNVKNKPIESQVNEIIENLQKVLPIKIEIRKIKLTIPAIHVGKAYGVISEFKQDEEWLSNGDLVVKVTVPAGLLLDFYDKLNKATHGACLSEELK
ncbi:MAG: ribosome assembly factor SBDS [Candidatus Pacearchaeota archaeon]